jgi:hypothetical protein
MVEPSERGTVHSRSRVFAPLVRQPNSMGASGRPGHWLLSSPVLRSIGLLVRSGRSISENLRGPTLRGPFTRPGKMLGVLTKGPEWPPRSGSPLVLSRAGTPFHEPHTRQDETAASSPRLGTRSGNRSRYAASRLVQKVPRRSRSDPAAWGRSSGRGPSPKGDPSPASSGLTRSGPLVDLSRRFSGCPGPRSDVP